LPPGIGRGVVAQDAHDRCKRKGGWVIAVFLLDHDAGDEKCDKLQGAYVDLLVFDLGVELFAEWE